MVRLRMGHWSSSVTKAKAGGDEEDGADGLVGVAVSFGGFVDGPADGEGECGECGEGEGDAGELQPRVQRGAGAGLP